MTSNLLSQQIVKAKLTGPRGADAIAAAKEEQAAQSGEVRFQFNPGKVKVTKTVKTDAASKVNSATLENAIVSSGNLVINLDEIRFFGPDTGKHVQTLLGWTEVTKDVGAGFSVTDAASGASWGVNSAGLAVLSLTWGTSLKYFVTLNQVTINYQRFLPTGTPNRVECNLSLQECPLPTTPTNPSSGGLPGRRQHLVVAEDSVVRIAHSAYGSPQSWRAVAEANGIDDPLRLRLGQRLFLPGPDELKETVR